VGWAGCLLLLLGFVGVAMSQEPLTPEALYQEHCTKCHAGNGKGKANLVKALKLEKQGVAALDLTKETTRGKTDDEYVKSILESPNHMKDGKPKVSPEEARLLARHLRALP
jgi:hypothetical protein